MTRKPQLKQKLLSGETVFAGWVQTGSAQYAASFVAGGLDAVVLDLQHCPMELSEMQRGVGEIIRAGASPIVRTPLSDTGMIGRALDTGAEAIIAPMINSKSDASGFAIAAKFPPVGQRSWGPTVIRDNWGMSSEEVLTTSNDWVVTWAMIETQQAVDQFEEIATSDGIDGVFVGPNDLSISLTDGKLASPKEPIVLDACEAIAKNAAKHNVFAGIFANTPELAKTYQSMGFQFIALGTDNALVETGVKYVLDQVRG